MHLTRSALPIALLISITLGACGGGGGGGLPEEDAAPPPSGLRGTVRLPNMELGRVAELEPNDTPAQAHRLAALFAGSAMEIAGVAAADAVDLGELDTTDIFRLVSLSDQEVTLTLEARRIGAAAIDVAFEVSEEETGALLDSDMGAGPLTATFAATAGTAYDLTVRMLTGSAAYVISIGLADPGMAPLRIPLERRAKPVDGRAAVQAPTASACACGHVLVRLEDGVDVDAFCRTHGLKPERRLASGTWCLGYAHVGEAEGQQKARTLSTSLADAEGVVFAEPDWAVQPLAEASDPLYGAQWNLRAIGCEAAWDVTKGDPNVIIGVIDAGVLPNHPDLEGRLVPGYDFITDPATALDGDSRDTDPSDPGDRFLPSGLSTWHGTHVAGICVANQDDGFGITGVAPGCRVMPLRALGLGGGLVSDVADAILFGAGLTGVPGRPALTEPLRVLNLSIGLNVDSAEMRSACDRAFNRGVFIVGATGNNGGGVLYPARYDSVFAVAAVDARLSATAYSNFGPEVDIAAPGGLGTFDRWARGWPDHVLSCVRDETVFPFVAGHAGYEGTSQAAPHVAGAAALLISIDPTLNSIDLTNILRGTALDVGPSGYDVANGAGLLQVHQAVKAVLANLGTPRSDDPVPVIATRSIQFVGFDTQHTIPISNGGGGVLTVTAAQSSTDDGGMWLSANLQPAFPGGDSNVVNVRITVDRNGLADGRYSGTIRLANPAGVLAAIRVVMYVDRIPRVGLPLRLAALEEGTGTARRVTRVLPEQGWRYWLTGMPTTSYLIKAGEDLDKDGFFCEPADACGWYGGPDEMDAIPVELDPDEPATTGLHVLLLPPP